SSLTGPGAVSMVAGAMAIITAMTVAMGTGSLAADEGAGCAFAGARHTERAAHFLRETAEETAVPRPRKAVRAGNAAREGRIGTADGTSAGQRVHRDDGTRL